MSGSPDETDRRQAPLAQVARSWTWLGLVGFGGPPAHVALLRTLVVEREGWMNASAFEDANAACGLLPGPASTQLAIFCAYRVGGPAGAIIGGLGFIVPAVVLILALSEVFLAHRPPTWILGAGAGAGAAVAAVAVQAGRGLMGASYRRAEGDRARTVRWAAYLVAGAAGAVWLGEYLVLVLLGCGMVELLARRPGSLLSRPSAILPLVPAAISGGGLGALAWTAFKVGALAFGGGFVIIPLMQTDAVHVHHWMTNAQFLNAVALGQVTPGPVVATVAAVGFAAHGLGGGLLAAAVAFAPSFSFILLAGGRFERVRTNPNARAFLDGAGPAAIGAILGSAVLLTGALAQTWQFIVLAFAAVALLLGRRGTVETLLTASGAGVILALAGVSVS